MTHHSHIKKHQNSTYHTLSHKLYHHYPFFLPKPVSSTIFTSRSPATPFTQGQYSDACMHSNHSLSVKFFLATWARFKPTGELITTKSQKCMSISMYLPSLLNCNIQDLSYTHVVLSPYLYLSNFPSMGVHSLPLSPLFSVHSKHLYFFG